jgi:RIO-like serine/threonine protein kinase
MIIEMHGDANRCNIVISDDKIYFIDFDKSFPIDSINDERVQSYLNTDCDWEEDPKDFILYEITQFIQD